MAADTKALGAWIARSKAPRAPLPDAAAPAGAKPGGIDFAALMRRDYEAASPEQRARIDARRAERDRIAATRAEIPAVFEREALRPGRRAGEPGERYVVKAWTQNVGIQIEGEPGREVVQFTQAVTGYEAFGLSEEFCALLVDPDENRKRPRFYICAGTPGRYDACSVTTSDVVDYLRERRPEMFPEPAFPGP